MNTKKTKIRNVNDRLTQKYGDENSPARIKLKIEALLEYYALELEDIPIQDVEKRVAKYQEMLEKIKEIRKISGLTQQELADKVGLKHNYISHVEKGNTDIQLSSFFKIISALGLKINFEIA